MQFRLKVRFIINPIAGKSNKADDTKKLAEKFFTPQRYYLDIKITRKQGDAFVFSKEGAEAEYDVVIACGGDGTIHEVASALVGTNTALGILPLGSGNGLARALHLPFNSEEAIGIVMKGRRREIDVGVICDRYFFSTAGLGFDALLSKLYNKRSMASKRRGILPYIPLTLKEFIRYIPETVTIRYGDSELSMASFILTFANTEQFGGGAIIAPRAKPDDGLLDVCIIQKPGFFGAVMYSLKLFSGKIDTMKGYKRILTPSVHILRPSPGPVQADGEPFEWGKRIKVGILPRSLSVCVA